eukprot:c17281_g1_i1 orf=295-1383(+)
MANLHQVEPYCTRRSLSIALLLVLFLHVLPLAIAHGGSSDSSDALAPDGSGPNLRSKTLILVKIYCLIIVFFATFIAGVSPYFYRWDESFLVLGTQFAGGVFLGTAMMHFLADSSSSFDELTTISYPFSYMLACAGYLLTMGGDCIIQYIFLKEGSATCKVDAELANLPQGPGVDPYAEDAARRRDDAAIDHESKNLVVATLVSKTSFGDTLLLILALCFHSVFEGIAIGVAQNPADAWRALWTISLHKIFAAVAMGIALLRLIPDRPFLQCVTYSFAFGISSPIGVAIGIIIDQTTEGRVADWIYGIAMGIACGVFVYVAINHLLAKGYIPQRKLHVDTPFYKFFAVTLGVGILAVVMTWD